MLGHCHIIVTLTIIPYTVLEHEVALVVARTACSMTGQSARTQLVTIRTGLEMGNQHFSNVQPTHPTRVAVHHECVAVC
jgi:hypothetical protein